MNFDEALELLTRWQKEAARLRKALIAIAQYETDWSKGVAENVGALQAMAEAAING